MFKFYNKAKNKEKKKKKKKGPVWLLLYMCIGALIGGILGPLVYGNYYEVIGDSIIEIGNLIEKYAFEIYTFASISLFIVSIVLTIIGRKRFLESIARGDEVYNEGLMSIAVGSTGITTMVSFILLIPAAKIIFITHNKSQSLVALIVLLIVVPGCIILQNRLVEDMKKGYPERHGDVYDINFNKDMINSFDEREKSNMHEAAFKSYTITSKFIFGLTIVLLFISLIVNISIGLVFSLLAIMATMNISYVYYCIKLEKAK